MRFSDIPEIASLSTPEKILLVEELWDRISSDESSVSVPQSYISELERRLNKYKVDPGSLLSLDDLRKRIVGRNEL